MPAFGSIAQTCNLQVKFEVSTIVFRVRKEVCSSLPGLGFLCSGAELPLLHAHQMLWPGHSHWRCSGCIYACVRAILHTEGGSSHAREVNKGRRQRTVLAGGGHVGIPQNIGGSTPCACPDRPATLQPTPAPVAPQPQHPIASGRP